MAPDPELDDESVADDDRLLRFYARERYTLAAGETLEQLDLAGLTERLSGFGFQALPDKNSGLLGMSAYVERLLPEGKGPEDLLAWWNAEMAKTPNSLVAIVAGSLRTPEIGLGIRLDPVDEPFGEAHVNVALPVEGGQRFSGGLKKRVRQQAVVIIP